MSGEVIKANSPPRSATKANGPEPTARQHLRPWLKHCNTSDTTLHPEDSHRSTGYHPTADYT
jgi:hypothetical protein